MAQYEWMKTDEDRKRERRAKRWRSVKMTLLVVAILLLVALWMVLQRTTIVIANGAMYQLLYRMNDIAGFFLLAIVILLILILAELKKINLK